MVSKDKMKKTLIYCGILLLLANYKTLAQDSFSETTFAADELLVYKSVDGVDLNLHVFKPKDNRYSSKAPVIIFFFGGGWNGGTPKQFYEQSRYLANQGMVAISAEYRVKSRNNTTPFECVKDAKSAVRWVRQHAQQLGVNPNKIVASGGSAGGHIAACTGIIKGYEEAGEDFSLSSVPNAMILFNPVLDTSEKGYGSERFDKDYKTSISPCHHIDSNIMPTLLFHGTGDKTVPFENAERFTKLMQKAGNQCELVAFEGRNHGFFNGSFFRPKTEDVSDYKKTMDKSVSFLTSLGYLESSTVPKTKLKFTQAPENYQLYARNEKDSATVHIEGKVDGVPNFEKLLLKVFKDGKPYNQHESSLTNKQFSFSTQIYSGLNQFKFELYAKKEKIDSLCFVADSIVCGDAYIISGQSNSHASSKFSIYSSPYCRSFGVKTGYESYSEEDKKVHWGRATGNAPGIKKGGAWFKKNPFGVGVWGMQLMKEIVEEHKVPVCIINGGSGSSSIEQNMLYPERPSLETSFGRLAYRTNQAGLKDKVKAILWHQGETNSNTIKGHQNYTSNFNQLLSDWQRVYTGLEKIYLFQLHPGCGGKYQSEMREIQHQIAKQNEMIDIMSTNGVLGHDGCHFSYEGYLEFAHRIFPLVSRDFYDAKTDFAITPPVLLDAKYNKEHEVLLTFDQPIKLEDKKEVKGKVHFLKDQFFFGMKNTDHHESGIVKKITTSEDQIKLKLNDEAVFNQITYLPNKTYLNTKEVYNGPWIRGAENIIGALSFHKKAITKKTTLSKNDKDRFHGFTMLDSTLNGINFKMVFPKKANKNGDWIWRARFWGHEPQTDLALLKQGFHLAYIDVSGLFGNEKAIKIWNEFYDLITTKYLLNPKVVLEGMSRGGLIVFNWANRNADKVACIYTDAPVCDLKSWPGGKGKSEGSSEAWKLSLKQYGFSEEIALGYNGNPVDHMEGIASHKVPVLNVIGDLDTVVPVSENTEILQKRLISLGWKMTIINKPKVGHHPHSLKDPEPIVDFVLGNTGNK